MSSCGAAGNCRGEVYPGSIKKSPPQAASSTFSPAARGRDPRSFLRRRRKKEHRNIHAKSRFGGTRQDVKCGALFLSNTSAAPRLCRRRHKSWLRWLPPKRKPPSLTRVLANNMADWVRTHAVSVKLHIEQIVFSLYYIYRQRLARKKRKKFNPQRR